jgi:hypothetical protein
VLYPVTALKKANGTLEQGAVEGGQLGVRPQALGFDPRGEYCYAEDRSHALVLFTPQGIRKKGYTFERPDMSWPQRTNREGEVIQEAGSRPWQEGDPDGAGNVRQYLVHPAGNRIVLLTPPAVYAVELPWKPVAIAPWKPGLQLPEKPPDRSPGEPLKGAVFRVDDLKVTPLRLPARSLLPCMLWADAAGTTFLTLEGNTGLLRRISFPDCKVVKQKELDRKFSWMSLSAEGLLLSEPAAEEVWMIDPVSLELKAKVGVPNLKRASSAPGLSWAIACDQGTRQTQKLYRVDLVKKTAVNVEVPQGPGFHPQRGKVPVNFLGVDNPVVTPDGTHVFAEGNNPPAPLPNTFVPPVLSRYSWKDGKLEHEESTEPPGRKYRDNVVSPAGITISPDGQFVCLPRPDPSLYMYHWEDAADRDRIATPVYPVNRLKKPSCALEQGAVAAGRPNVRPEAVGFDPKAGLLYAQDAFHEFVVFTTGGVKKKVYALSGESPGTGPLYEVHVAQYLVHPAGYRVMVLTASAVYAVEVPGRQ